MFIGLFQDYNPEVNSSRKEMIKNLVRINENSENILENVYFSDENIDLINKQIILSVWKKTNYEYKIKFQSKEQLLIVMRYVFSEYAKYLPYNIKQQIIDLNCITVGEIIPNIITNCKQHIDYIKDITKPRQLLETPKSTSIGRTFNKAII